MIAWTVPGAAAATPDSAGANVRPVHAAHAAAAPSTTCTDDGTSHSIQVSADLSDVHPTAKWTKKDPTKLVFELKAAPRFGLNLDFSGHVECDTELTLAEIPIGDTGLVLQIGPELEFDATGQIGADFTWKPSLEVGFTIDKTKFVKGPLAFANGTAVVFTGSGSLTMHLFLHAVIETVGGLIGVEGDIGPKLVAKVTGTTGTDTACWKVGAVADAEFNTFVSAFGFTKKFFSKDWQLGKEKSFGACLAKTIVFDGSPGTDAPPATLGPYTMTPFAADPSPVGTVESKLSGPTGTVGFDPSLTHAMVADGWETWSNGYTGDVYIDDSELPDGNFEITVTLPPGTGAFYAYVEPDLFKDYAINATADNGVTSGDVTVNGDAGARYFGFYATCGHTITSITYVDSGGDSAMAIGEFGIAAAC